MGVRLAQIADADAIANLHVRGWQVAYAGVVPQSFLDALSVSERAAMWRKRLESSNATTWVCEVGGSVGGWATAGTCRDPLAGSGWGELWAIYIDPDLWRQGIGRHLWSAAKDFFQQAGLSPVTVWVLQANDRAIEFYRALGFVEDGEKKQLDIGGELLEEIRLQIAVSE